MYKAEELIRVIKGLKGEACEIALLAQFIMNIDDVNGTDLEGKTSLHWAVISESELAVKVLLAKKADPNIPDKNNNMPLDYAKAKSFQKIVLELEKKGAQSTVSENSTKPKP